RGPRSAELSALSLHDALPIFGARAYVEAVGTTILVFIALIALSRVEESIIRRRFERRVEVVMDMSPGLLGAVREAFLEAGFIVKDRKSTRLNSSHVKISYAVF